MVVVSNLGFQLLREENLDSMDKFDPDLVTVQLFGNPPSGKPMLRRGDCRATDKVNYSLKSVAESSRL